MLKDLFPFLFPFCGKMFLIRSWGRAAFKHKKKEIPTRRENEIKKKGTLLSVYNNPISFREEDKYMVPQFTNETVKIEKKIWFSFQEKNIWTTTPICFSSIDN